MPTDRSPAATSFLAHMWAWYILAVLIVGVAYLGSVVLHAIL